MLSTVLQLVGFVLIVTAGFVLSPSVGVLAFGVVLVAVGVALERE